MCLVIVSDCQLSVSVRFDNTTSNTLYVNFASRIVVFLYLIFVALVGVGKSGILNNTDCLELFCIEMKIKIYTHTYPLNVVSK